MVAPELIHIQNLVTGFRSGGKESRLGSIGELVFRGGDLVAVVGANGVGKSTLLRTICGLHAPLEGKVMFAGKELKKYNRYELASRVAVVLTHRVEGFNLRVRDLVAAGQLPYTNIFNRLSEEQKAIVAEEIQRCGLSGLEERFAGELSDGQYQKAMIARALAQRTPVILLDEPGAFLDYPSKHELFQLLKQQAEGGKCVIVSTHDLEQALRYCNKMLVMEAQKVRLINSSEAWTDEGFRRVAGGFVAGFNG